MPFSGGPGRSEGPRRAAAVHLVWEKPLAFDFSEASWLPPGKQAAICFHIDDIHPGRSTDPYEAGGDLDKGALGHVAWLLQRHPKLHVTLFTTPDWREISAAPTRPLLAAIPWLRDRVYLTPIRPKGQMRLGRHPAFVAYLKGLARTEIALHGLYHINTGPRVPVEFAGKTQAQCHDILTEALAIFAEAGLPAPTGLQPPAWEMPEALVAAMAGIGLGYVCAARDILTPVTPGALGAMSGPRGLPLYRPCRIFGDRLCHIPTNFQATSPIERAAEIIEQGGLVSIKGHIIKLAMGHMMLDGIDGVYCNYLDRLFAELDRRYGDALWWTSTAGITRQITRQMAGAA